MLLNFKPFGKSAVTRSFLLSAGAFLLLSVAGLSSSSEADESLFVRSAQQLERLWGGVLGCAESDEPFTIRNRFDEEGDAQTTIPAGASRDYSECGRRALRNASSRMLVDVVEDALQEGGLALFEEGFRIDSLWLNTGAGGTGRVLSSVRQEAVGTPSCILYAREEDGPSTYT